MWPKDGAALPKQKFIVYISGLKKTFLNLIPSPKNSYKGQKLAPQGPKQCKIRPQMWLNQKQKDRTVSPK